MGRMKDLIHQGCSECGHDTFSRHLLNVCSRCGAMGSMSPITGKRKENGGIEGGGRTGDGVRAGGGAGRCGGHDQLGGQTERGQEKRKDSQGCGGAPAVVCGALPVSDFLRSRENQRGASGALGQGLETGILDDGPFSQCGGLAGSGGSVGEIYVVVRLRMSRFGDIHILGARVYHDVDNAISDCRHAAAMGIGYINRVFFED